MPLPARRWADGGAGAARGRRAVLGGALFLAAGALGAGCAAASKSAPEGTVAHDPGVATTGHDGAGLAETERLAAEEARRAEEAAMTTAAAPAPEPAAEPPASHEPPVAIAGGAAGREVVLRDPRASRRAGREMSGADSLFAESVGGDAARPHPPLFVVGLEAEHVFDLAPDDAHALARGAGEPAWVLPPDGSVGADATAPLDLDGLLAVARRAGARGLAVVRFVGEGRARRASLALVDLSTGRTVAVRDALEPSFEVVGSALRGCLLDR